jgi:acetylornithine deacetylase/succinyl-diaminopimelate desuccinylase-like protein
MTSPLDLAVARRAADACRALDEATLEAQIELSEIPAPPFQEAARGARMAELFAAAGLQVFTDAVGNVIGGRPRGGDGAPLVVSAHLDTVFAAETDVRVRRDGDFLVGPGISDDARGLATLLTLARVLEAEAVDTEHPVRFVATVGEEGIGDLRGVKHLFGSAGSCRNAHGFISLDGAGIERIVTRGLGSRRYRITASGPGGHSWVDWGTPNPLHALMGLGAALADLELAADPLTTLTVARSGGGTSINAIPQSSWIEIDTRCKDPAPLEELEGRIRAEARERARTTGVEIDVQVVGDRPAGRTAPESALVRAAMEATRAVGREPRLALSSTDANVPMQQGIPALTIGCGGEAGLAHTTDEWYRNRGGADGVVRALYTVLLAAGVRS